MSEITNILLSALYGAVASGLTAGSFYFKNIQKGEKFEVNKLIITVAIATLAGAISSFGFDPNPIVTGAIATSIGLFIENIFKGFKQRQT